MSELYVPDAADREDLATFTARVVRLDPSAPVRLRARDGRVHAWAPTPFDVLVTRVVPGTLAPPDVVVRAEQLLASLAVSRAARVDPGTRLDAGWRSELPPEDGWRPVAEVAVAELAAVEPTVLGHDPARLDEPACTAGDRVAVPVRCVVALAGMGLLDGPDPVRVSATPSWLRLDARLGAAVRRRQVLLALVSAGR